MAWPNKDTRISLNLWLQPSSTFFMYLRYLSKEHVLSTTDNFANQHDQLSAIVYNLVIVGTEWQDQHQYTLYMQEWLTDGHRQTLGRPSPSGLVGRLAPPPQKWLADGPLLLRSGWQMGPSPSEVVGRWAPPPQKWLTDGPLPLRSGWQMGIGRHLVAPPPQKWLADGPLPLRSGWQMGTGRHLVAPPPQEWLADGHW